MKRSWVIKAIVQKSISFLPQSHRINYFFQKNVTGGVLLTDEYFGQKLEHAREHLEFLREKFGNRNDLQILELGTGWYPVIPMLLFLTGSGKVHSVDIRGWMTRETQQLTLLKFRDWKARGLLDEIWNQVDEERWRALVKVAEAPESVDQVEFNRLIGLHPVVGDARHLTLPDELVDFVCSNNTFEHIPGTILRDILAEFMRVLKKGGYMNHFIDMSDHFAHFDPSITIYNFLKFSERQWALIDNNIQPQNRMRLVDYHRMYEELGIEIIDEKIREGELNDLRKIRPHSCFSAYSEIDLAISHASLMSVKH